LPTFAGAHGEHLLKPKPFSIRQRFWALQSLSVALALWFVAATVYVNRRIRMELEQFVDHTRRITGLEADIADATQQIQALAESARWRPAAQPGPEFRLAAEKLRESAHRLPGRLTANEPRARAESLGPLQEQMIGKLEELYQAEPATPEAEALFRSINESGMAVESVLRGIRADQLAELEATVERLQSHTRILYLLLFVFAVAVVLVLRSFRVLHERHLWEPVGRLRRIVREIRRGNLDVRTGIPASVELAPLTESFLRMASELRTAREALEKKVEEQTLELDTTHRKLVEAAKLSTLGQLASGVAHEVNNPLTSILGFSEVLLARPEVDGQARVHLQTIRSEALRLRNVVANLNSFARRGPQRIVRMDLRTVLDRAVELRHGHLAAENIQLRYERPWEAVWVDGDTDQLLQVVFNLLLNAEQAIQAGPQKGHIILDCGTENGEAFLRVRDNGVGMSRDVLEHIFEPYFTTKPTGEASGLGLSISHGIVEQHHGGIQVETTAGRGSTFCVRLPLAPALATLTATPAKNAEPPPIQTGRALVIDDEEGIVGLVEEVLGKRGWTCTTLTDPNQVESVLEGRDFDAVFCDWKMPERDGLAILRMLTEKRPAAARRFILMTGNPEEAKKQVSHLSGLAILPKPFTLAQLDEALRSVQQEEKPRPANAREPVDNGNSGLPR